MPEHQPAAVQGVRPVGQNGRTSGHAVPERGGGAARGGADQRLENTRPAPSAHRAGHVGGHVERPPWPPPPAAGRAAHRRPDTGRLAVAVLHRRVVGVAGADGHRAGGRAVADRRPADAVQRHKLVRGGHDHGRVEDCQVRRGRRHHSRGRHTGNARLRIRSGQRGLRHRVHRVHHPGPDRARPNVRVRRRHRRPTTVPGLWRPAAFVPRRRPLRQPVGRAP